MKQLSKQRINTLPAETTPINTAFTSTKFAHILPVNVFHAGIVLKKYPYKNKIALFDRKRGRIYGIMPVTTMLSAGTLVSYDPKKADTNTYFLHSCDILDNPLLSGKLDIYFLHHVLEWCYYSLPLGTIDQVVFDILVYLYTRDPGSWSSSAKIIFIFKLIISLGIYSDHPLLHTPSIIPLCALPIDKVFEGTIHLERMPAIHDWIAHCFAEHPFRNQFKTMNFLDQKYTP